MQQTATLKWFLKGGVFMFKIKDYVLYASTGACQILDIRKERNYNGNEIEYYIMQPAFTRNITIKVPVDHPKIPMRKVISKEAVTSLIASMPEKETYWIPECRQRSEAYKAALRTGDCQEWIRLIKTIYLEKQEKSAAGKKLLKTDQDIMKAAEKLLYEEFALALGIHPDEVIGYILDHVS
jgi:CarD family transcriptional regulator